MPSYDYESSQDILTQIKVTVCFGGNTKRKWFDKAEQLMRISGETSLRKSIQLLEVICCIFNK